MAKYAVGQRIYNHGDMANSPHFGTIIQVKQGSGSKIHYLIKPDSKSNRSAYWIGEYMFSPVFKGHSGTRIVTEEAYKAWRKNQLAQLERRLAQLGIKTDSAIKKFIVKDNKIYKLKDAYSMQEAEKIVKPYIGKTVSIGYGSPVKVVALTKGKSGLYPHVKYSDGTEQTIDSFVHQIKSGHIKIKDSDSFKTVGFYKAVNSVTKDFATFANLSDAKKWCNSQDNYSYVVDLRTGSKVYGNL